MNTRTDNNTERGFAGSLDENRQDYTPNALAKRGPALDDKPSCGGEAAPLFGAGRSTPVRARSAVRHGLQPNNTWIPKHHSAHLRSSDTSLPNTMKTAGDPLCLKGTSPPTVRGILLGPVFHLHRPDVQFLRKGRTTSSAPSNRHPLFTDARVHSPSTYFICEGGHSRGGRAILTICAECSGATSSS
jgi:hypothetical protein